MPPNRTNAKVYVECEAVSLTRDVPASFGWLLSRSSANCLANPCSIRSWPQELLSATILSLAEIRTETAKQPGRSSLWTRPEPKTGHRITPLHSRFPQLRRPHGRTRRRSMAGRLHSRSNRCNICCPSQPCSHTRGVHTLWFSFQPYHPPALFITTRTSQKQSLSVSSSPTYETPPHQNWRILSKI